MKSKKKSKKIITIKQKAGFLEDNSEKIVNRLSEILITMDIFSKMVDNEDDIVSIEKISNFQRGGKKIFTRE